jgi:O-antigen/teichoic acid export membrane protein
MLRNTLIALQGTVIAQGIGFLFLPLLTRLYPPEAFAGYQLYMSILMLLLVIVALRYENALLVAKKAGEVRAVLWLCFALTVITGVLVLATCTGLIFWPPTWLNVSGTVLLLLGVGVVAGGLFQTLGFILLREQALAMNAVSKITQVSFFCIGGLAAATTRFAPIGMVGADVLGRIVAAGLILFWIARNHPAVLARVEASELGRTAHRFRQYPMLAVPGALLTAMIGFLVPIFMLTAFDITTMGQYVLAERTILAPAGLIGQSVAQAFTAQLSTTMQNGSDNHPAFRKVVLIMLALGLIPALALVGFAPYLFKLVFGAQWAMAGDFAQILSVVFLSTFAMAPISMTLQLAGRQRDQFAWEAVRLILVGAAWAMIIRLGLLPFQAIAIHAAILVLMNVVFIWLANRALQSES